MPLKHEANYMSDTVVIYDTEFTTWEGALQCGWSEPWMHRELVQIAAIRYRLDDMSALDQLDVLVKPVINSELSDYFTQLTGVTQADVAQHGLDFPDAHDRLCRFIGDTPAWAYGTDDEVVRENQHLHKMPQDFHSLNIGPWFMEHGKPFGIVKGVNSGRLAKTLGIDAIEGAGEHNALYDVRSIAAAYRNLTQKHGAPAFTG